MCRLYSVQPTHACVFLSSTFVHTVIFVVVVVDLLCKHNIYCMSVALLLFVVLSFPSPNHGSNDRGWRMLYRL